MLQTLLWLELLLFVFRKECKLLQIMSISNPLGTEMAAALQPSRIPALPVITIPNNDREIEERKMKLP